MQLVTVQSFSVKTVFPQAVYGEMFPEEELARLNDKSPDISGRATIDSIFSKVCDWVQPGTGDLVFPNRTLSMIEDGVNLDSIFL